MIIGSVRQLIVGKIYKDSDFKPKMRLADHSLRYYETFTLWS